jgi:hypothetical protein
VAQIPSDYYTRWRTAYPNDTLIFAEIDWDTAGTSSPADQANFVNALPTLMQGVNPSMLAWALPFDCSCFAAANLTQEQITFFQNTYNVNLTNLFSSFNAEGMIGANGVAKPAWTAALALFGLAQSPPMASSSQGQ